MTSAAASAAVSSRRDPTDSVAAYDTGDRYNVGAANSVSPSSRIRVPLALLVVVGGLAGCAGGGDEPESAAAHADGEPTTTQLSSVGCDVAAQCFPQLAQATLDRCPARRLSPHGQEARRRLERVLARITGVDLHNEQAYEATDAVLAALAELEQACLPRG